MEKINKNTGVDDTDKKSNVSDAIKSEASVCGHKWQKSTLFPAIYYCIFCKKEMLG